MKFLFQLRFSITLVFLLAGNLLKGQSIPSWFQSEMENRVGRWIASNEKYKSGTEPYGHYGIEWKWGLGKTTLEGRLFGMNGDTEAGDFWQYRQYWDPVKGQGVLIQFGYGGQVGEGPVSQMKDGKLETIQRFSAPGSPVREERHISFTEGDRHTTTSFDKDQYGEWKEKRTYVWIRQSTGTTDEKYDLYLANLAAAEAFLQLKNIREAKKFLDACEEKSRGYEWKFLHGFLNQHTRDLTTKPNTSFFDVKLNPANTLLAHAGSDSTVWLYRYPEMEKLHALRGHRGTITTLAFSNDGKTIASAGRDHAVILWDVESGKQIAKNENAFSQGIYEVRFNHHDNKLAAVSWEWKKDQGVMGFVSLLDARNATEIRRIETEPHPASGVVFTPEDKNIIVSTWGQIIFSYDAESGKTNWSYDLSDPAEYNNFQCIDLSPDGTTVAAGSTDHRIHILNSADGKLLHRIEPWEGHSRTVKTVRFSPDGKLLASSGDDQVICLWNTSGYTKISSWIGHGKTVNGISWSSSGDKLFSASSDGTIKMWDRAKPFEVSFDVCNNGPWQLPVTGRSFLAAPCSDSTLVMYDAGTGEPVRNFGKHSGLCADFSRDGKALVTSSFDGVVRVWNTESGRQEHMFKAHTGRVDGVAFRQSAGQVLSVGDTTLRIWDIKRGKPVAVIPFPKNVFRISLNPEQTHAWISSGNEIRSINLRTLKEERMLSCQGGVLAMDISRDGKQLAAFCGNTVEVWDLEKFTRKWTLKGHEQSGYGIGFSHDGHYLISGSYDQTFKLWNLDNGRCTLTFHGYTDTIYSARILSENELVVASSNGIIRYYNFSPSR